MKNLLIFLSAVTIALSCTACGNNEELEALRKENEELKQSLSSNISEDAINVSKENIEPYLETLGVNTDGKDLTLSADAYNNRANVNLLGVAGTVSSGFTDESATQIRYVEWVSNYELSANDFNKFIQTMNKFENSEASLTSYDNISPETYVWTDRSHSAYVMSWFESNKIFVRWYYEEVLAPTTAPSTPAPTTSPTAAPAGKEFIRENYGYVSYDDLARNPDDYTGKSLTYSGKVIQVIEDDESVQHRIAVNGDYDTVIFDEYPKDMVASRILDDDWVNIYGRFVGLITYEATSGASITIPGIYLDRIELQ